MKCLFSRMHLVITSLILPLVLQPLLAGTAPQPTSELKPSTTKVVDKAASTAADAPTPNNNAWLIVSETVPIAKEVAAKALAKREYYLMPADRVCTANNPTRTRLKTWRSKLSFDANGSLLVWGTLCNDSPELIPWDKLVGTVLVSADFNHINYAGSVYIYLAKPPAICPAGLWCPVDK